MAYSEYPIPVIANEAIKWCITKHFRDGKLLSTVSWFSPLGAFRGGDFAHSECRARTVPNGATVKLEGKVYEFRCVSQGESVPENVLVSGMLVDGDILMVVAVPPPVQR